MQGPRLSPARCSFLGHSQRTALPRYHQEIGNPWLTKQLQGRILRRSIVDLGLLGSYSELGEGSLLSALGHGRPEAVEEGWCTVKLMIVAVVIPDVTEPTLQLPIPR